MRVHQWQDAASWNEFYRLYHKLIYGLARRSGLTHADAEDVTQDVFKRVAETIQEFESNPQRGTFRGWLMNLTRWRITDKYRSHAKTPEQQKAGMDAWMAWGKKAQSSIADMGGPLGKSMHVTNTGSSASTNDLGGFSVMHAETKEA